LRAEPALPKRVLAAAAALAATAGLPEPRSAVVSVVLGGAQRVISATAECLAQGVRVVGFRPPAVPEGTSPLRLTAHAGLTDDDVAHVAEVLGAVLAEARA
ncbi:MAG TPA: 8-amino-7-oxononanoate synthase, partial [Pseudonocardiaceae bacterium]|nr:8-amino-7-oxononanoate synthase [Pseudonocardiaceae bacterium]